MFLVEVGAPLKAEKNTISSTNYPCVLESADLSVSGLHVGSLLSTPTAHD